MALLDDDDPTLFPKLTDAFAACGYWPELRLGVAATDDTRASVCFYGMLRSPALPECSAARRRRP